MPSPTTPDAPPEPAWPRRIARRTQRYTWMLNGWTNTVTLDRAGGGTECLTIAVPDDFTAVRVGFANATATPWTVRKVIARASAAWNDGIAPVAAVGAAPSPWSVLTFQGGGADADVLVADPGAPTEITVAGNAADPDAAETGNPRWTFTDWVACPSAAPDPATGMRVLMLRTLVPGAQTVTFTNGRMTEYSANPAVNRGYGYFCGGLRADSDLVSEPDRVLPKHIDRATLDANHLVNGQLTALVQVMTRNAGIVGLIAGDSHQAGTSSLSGINNFLVQCLLELGRDSVGSVPLGVASTAVGGLTARQFFPRMTALLPALRPSFVVLPGWSYNDRDATGHATAAAEDLVLLRLMLAADQVRAAGALPIFITPFPRDAAAMTPEVRRVWLASRDTMLALRDTGELVFDATPLLAATGPAGFTGLYRDGLSSDAIHPNNTGHAVLARAFASFLEPIIGLRRDPTRAWPIDPTLDQTPAPRRSLDALDREAFVAQLRWHAG